MITVVIPAYNESGNLVRAVKKLTQLLNRQKYKYEILISEDGSTDKTFEIAARLARKNPRIKVFHSDKRRGKGGAIKFAFKKSRGNILIFSDADLFNFVSSFPVFVKKLEGDCDVCIGSRYLPSSKSHRSVQRFFLSKSYNFLIKLLFNTNISDFQCGIKGFKKKTLPTILATKNNGFFWDTEILLMAEKKKLKISEIPISWSENKKSNVNLSKDSFQFFFNLIKLRLDFSRD